jgi:hypothetical protein
MHLCSTYKNHIVFERVIASGNEPVKILDPILTRTSEEFHWPNVLGSVPYNEFPVIVILNASGCTSRLPRLSGIVPRNRLFVRVLSIPIKWISGLID